MTDRLSTIFSHQLELTTQFREIQDQNGLLSTPGIPVNPLSREGCLELHKDLHWINLEMSEVLFAHGQEQVHEELADVMHFLAEFCHVAGLPCETLFKFPKGFKEQYPTADRLDLLLVASAKDPLVFPDYVTNARFVILAVLRVADYLKNKPWKQSIKSDWDQDEFEDRVRGVFYWYGATVRTAGMTPEALFDAYMGTKAKNDGRIESGV